MKYYNNEAFILQVQKCLKHFTLPQFHEEDFRGTEDNSK